MNNMLDHTDREIINCLQENARMQANQIGEKIHMTRPAVANRIQRLEKMGIIEGYTVKINEKLLGNIYCCYISVYTKDNADTKFKEFIQTREAIKEAHQTSEDHSFILKVQLSDHEDLAKLLDEILVYGHYKINISIGQCK
jgi:Lrp/AsnC family leucine-responsive transcriptional regulator